MSSTTIVQPLIDHTPEDCDTLRHPAINNIVDSNNDLQNRAKNWAQQNGFQPASKDDVRIAVVMIDNQIDFCQSHGALYVQGAEHDTARTSRFIQENMAVITTLIPTLDTHRTFQIFHPAMFVANHDFTMTQPGGVTVDIHKGDHPLPYTLMNHEDIANGHWVANPRAAYAILKDSAKYMALNNHCIYYGAELHRLNRYQLTIWPYHTMLGTPGHALVPALSEVCFIHDIARGNETDFQIKGGVPLTENYSPFCPEITQSEDGKPIAQRNTKILDTILNHDAVLFVGQAKSHCFAWAIDDLLNEIQNRDVSLANKIYLVEDCTSPVVVPGVIDYTDEANEAFKRFEAAGMHVVQSTTPITDYISM